MSDDAPKYERKIDRRTALIWVGVVGAATAAAGAGVIDAFLGLGPTIWNPGLRRNMVRPNRLSLIKLWDKTP